MTAHLRAEPALRALLLFLATLLALPGNAAEFSAPAAPPKRIVALNWWLAEHLLALGITPIAVADRAGYDQWVGEPALPDSVKSAGSRQSPNLAAIRALNPDLIVVSGHLQAAVPALRKIAPTLVQTTYEAGANPWHRARENLLELARVVGREDRAHQVLAAADRALAHTRARLHEAGLTGQPVYLVRFLDDKRGRIHGANSMLSQALVQVGLRNPWPNKTNQWGFTPGTLADLAEQPDAWLIYLRPWPEADRQRLQGSALWPYLPMAKNGQVAGVGPVWTFGGVLSVPRMATMLAEPLLAGAKPPTEAGHTPHTMTFEQAVRWYTQLPRFAMALLCGAALALAGVLIQQVLRNPLAAPTTLGVAAGAQLVLGLVLLLAPGLLAWREAAAMAGGLLALGLTLLMARKRGFDPLTLTLCGLIVSLYLGAINTVVLLFFHQQLASLFIWGAGELSQNDWQGVQALLPHLIVAATLSALLLRPLQALDLGTEGARALGLSPTLFRAIALVLAVYLTALTVSQVGVIGFLGLAAPALARLLGARTLAQRLLVAALAGAVLCLLADTLAQQLSALYSHLMFPTGAATALIGAPVILWLLTHQRFPSTQASAPAAVNAERTPAQVGAVTLLLIGLASVAIAALFGPTWDGWRWETALADNGLLAMRLPRLGTALFAGGLLALAGVIVQRLTRNPMASPELLGISTGAALGMVVLVLLAMTPGRPLQMLAGAAGGLLVLLTLLALSRRGGFSPQRLLLGGVALSAGLDAGIRMVLAFGDQEAVTLLNWLAGSTWLSGKQDALTLAIVTPVLAIISLAAARWLDLLPLGDSAAQALGVPLAPSRLALLLLAATMTAAATLVVGPLSFVGLMAPHLARLLGFRRARAQLLAAFVIGSLLMLWADWLARSLVYPYELPTGLVATLIGGAYFLVRLYRTPAPAGA